MFKIRLDLILRRLLKRFLRKKTLLLLRTSFRRKVFKQLIIKGENSKLSKGRLIIRVVLNKHVLRRNIVEVDGLGRSTSKGLTIHLDFFFKIDYNF